MNRSIPLLTVLRPAALALLLGLAACAKGGKGAADKGGTPAPAAENQSAPAAPRGPFQGGMGDAAGPTDEHAIALRTTGLSSAAEMNRDKARLDTPELRDDYEMAFRYTFSARAGQRNYPESIRLINKVVTERPGFAPGYRVLGYALFNTNRATDALAAYQRAVSIDPNYGEAHYALAFLFAMGDKASGREHYRRAMELGIVDERHLGEQFYPPTQ